ncbi:MAG: hypothetical protein ACLTX6_01985 [Lachnospiraceae bacterium]
MKFTLTADAPVKVPDVDTICLKKVKRVAIPERRTEQDKRYIRQRTAHAGRERMRMNRRGRIQ